jgi:hypothetical protein
MLQRQPTLTTWHHSMHGSDGHAAHTSLSNSPHHEVMDVLVHLPSSTTVLDGSTQLTSGPGPHGQRPGHQETGVVNNPSTD